MGDCAARGADLFESIAAEIISAMILGGTMAERCKIEGEVSDLALAKIKLKFLTNKKRETSCCMVLTT